MDAIAISQITTEKQKVIQSLTNMEKQILRAIIDGLYAEYGFSDIDVSDIVHTTKIDAYKARGVIASLVKKGVAYVYEHDANFKKQYFHYITDEYLWMHPKWYFEKTGEHIENDLTKKRIDDLLSTTKDKSILESTSVHFGIVTGFIGNVPNAYHPDTFSNIEIAKKVFMQEYRNRKKGDGHDAYWNKIPMVIQKVVTTITFEIDERESQ